MNTIHDIFLAVKGGAILENLIPSGASLPHWEALLNSYDPTAKRKPAKRTGSNGRGKRSNYAKMQSAIAGATLELVKRVNGDEAQPATDPNTDRAGRQQQIKALLAEIDADVKARLARRNAVYDAMLRPDPLNCEPRRGGWTVKE